MNSNSFNLMNCNSFSWRSQTGGQADLVIAFGNFEGTYYRYAKRYEQNQNWAPPPSEPLKRETKV
jgi:hypothetical protein